MFTSSERGLRPGQRLRAMRAGVLAIVTFGAAAALNAAPAILT
jgi:hypothetical protein